MISLKYVLHNYVTFIIYFYFPPLFLYFPILTIYFYFPSFWLLLEVWCPVCRSKLKERLCYGFTGPEFHRFSNVILVFFKNNCIAPSDKNNSADKILESWDQSQFWLISVSLRHWAGRYIKTLIFLHRFSKYHWYIWLTFLFAVFAISHLGRSISWGMKEN